MYLDTWEQCLPSVMTKTLGKVTKFGHLGTMFA